MWTTTARTAALIWQARCSRCRVKAMAFCTSCGANLTGAFCTQCGARVGRPAAGPASPPTRRGSAMKVVLVVILCLFGLGILGVIGTGAFVAHRMRRAGVDRELFRTNPELAI